jgi:hypothetical protein
MTLKAANKSETEEYIPKYEKNTLRRVRRTEVMMK